MKNINKKNKLPLLLVIIVFLLLGCSKKLLLPLTHGVFVQESKNLYKSDINIVLYPKNSFDVLASENCVVKIVEKVEQDYYILAVGKYEISYAMLTECFVKEGDTLQRGKKIGKLRAEQYGETNISYLMLTIKDNKGHYYYENNLFEK